MANKRKKVTEEELVMTPRLYVNHWVRLQGVLIDARGTPSDKNGRNQNAIFKSMWLDYQEQKNQINSRLGISGKRQLRGFSENDLKKAFEELSEDFMIEARRKMIDGLKCKQEDLSEMLSFVKALTGRSNTVTEAVLAHFIWQAKRKMLNLKVYDHLMPVINGPQGIGKTEAVKKLITPAEPCILRSRITDLIDSRSGLSLTPNFIGVFDEMQGASKADIDGLKNLITQDFASIRMLGTNDVVSVKQNCTFIGTTNKPISEQIFDSTGMRRFFEIKLVDKIDWNAINTIDYDKLWQGIDESKPNGYLSQVENELRAIQSELTAVDDVDDFLQEHGITLPTSDSEDVPCNQLYDTYRVWAANSGTKAITKQLLGRRLKSRGFEVISLTRNEKTMKYYRIGKAHASLSIVHSPTRMSIDHG